MTTKNTLTRLLVPLTDGSTDRSTLRAVADVARAAGSVVRLLYVRPGANVPPPAALSRDASCPKRGSADTLALDLLASSLGAARVDRVERVGDLEATILAEAAAWRADLVALSAGDRTWLSRAVHSGTAAKAFARGRIPALLYTPAHEAAACGVGVDGADVGPSLGT